MTHNTTIHPKLSALTMKEETAHHVSLGIERPHQLISHAGKVYINKLRAHHELAVIHNNAGKPIPLKNVIIMPDSNNPLEYPVFIGENGIPIILFQSAKGSNTQIGRGGFGEVYLGVEMDDLTQVHAVKVQPLTNDMQKIAIQQEEHILKTVGRLIDRLECASNGLWYSVQRLAPGVDLTSYKPKDLNERIGMVYAILQSVDLLHKKFGILHRDLKLQNIMFDGKTLSLVDFGTSVVADKDKDELFFKDTNLNPPQTPSYTDPDNYSAKESKEGDYLYFSAKSEIYALGVVIAQILGGKPYILKPQEEFQQSIAFMRANPKPAVLPRLENYCELILKPEYLDNQSQTTYEKTLQNLKNLVIKMINTDPNKRPNIPDLMKELDLIWDAYIESAPESEAIAADNPTELSETNFTLLTNERPIDFTNNYIDIPKINIPEMIFNGRNNIVEEPVDLGLSHLHKGNLMTELHQSTMTPERIPWENNQRSKLLDVLNLAEIMFSKEVIEHRQKKIKLEEPDSKPASVTFSYGTTPSQGIVSTPSTDELLKQLKTMSQNKSIAISDLINTARQFIAAVTAQYSQISNFEKSNAYQLMTRIESILSDTFEKSAAYQSAINQNNTISSDTISSNTKSSVKL